MCGVIGLPAFRESGYTPAEDIRTKREREEDKAEEVARGYEGKQEGGERNRQSPFMVGFVEL